MNLTSKHNVFLGAAFAFSLSALPVIAKEDTRTSPTQCSLNSAHQAFDSRKLPFALRCYERMWRNKHLDEKVRHEARIGIGSSLYSIARNESRNSRKLKLAIDHLMKAKSYFTAESDQNLAVRAGIFLGLSYLLVEDYETAIEQYTDILPHAKDFRLRHSILFNIALSYNELGEYEKSLAEYQSRARELINRPRYTKEYGNVLRNIGILLRDMGRFEESLKAHQSAARTFAKLGSMSPRTKANISHDLGYILLKLSRDEKAKEYLDPALELALKSGDLDLIADTYDSQGQLHTKLGNYELALLYLSRSLSISEQLDNFKRQRISLTNHGKLFEQQGQDKLAIFFYKKAVQINEKSRDELNKDRRGNRKYLERASHAYRSLIALLLEQGRVYEALEISRLLKTQEVDEYLRHRSISGKTKIKLSQPEKILEREYEKLKKSYNQVLLQNLSELSDPDPESEKEALAQEIFNFELELLNAHSAFMESEAVKNRIANDTGASSFNLATLRADIGELAQMKDTVMLHTMIFKDSMQLIYVLPGQPPKRQRVDVSKFELASTVSQALEYLRDPKKTNMEPATKLYSWVIAPIFEELKSNQIRNIIYAPEGSLRYIPLNTFRAPDGWLLDHFASYRVTGVTKNKIDNRRAKFPKVFIGSYPNKKHKVEIGTEFVVFEGLKHASNEAVEVANTFENSSHLPGESFDYSSSAFRMARSNIVHLATHAKFVSSDPGKSVILFGDGSALSLNEVKQRMQLSKADMVVLSACETGISLESNGSEILSFGTIMGEIGARSTVASLWSVSDASTSKLMQKFYSIYKQGTRKAEALQQSQQSLASGEIRAPSGEAYSHPYYWAPFFIIGNGH